MTITGPKLKWTPFLKCAMNNITNLYRLEQVLIWSKMSMPFFLHLQLCQINIEWKNSYKFYQKVSRVSDGNWVGRDKQISNLYGHLLFGPVAFLGDVRHVEGKSWKHEFACCGGDTLHPIWNDRLLPQGITSRWKIMKFRVRVQGYHSEQKFWVSKKL